MENKKELQFFQKTVNGRSAILRKNAEHETAIVNARIKKEIALEEEAAKERAKILKDLQDAKLRNNDVEIRKLQLQYDAANNDYLDKVKAREDAARSYREQCAKELDNILRSFETKQYSEMSARSRQAYQKKAAEELEIERKKYEEEYKLAKEAGDAIAASTAKKKAKQAEKQQKIAHAESERLLFATGPKKDIAEYTSQKLSQAKEKVSDAQATLKLAVRDNKDVIKAEKALEKARKTGNKQAIKDAEKAVKEAEKQAKSSRKYLEAERALKEANHEAEIAQEKAKNAQVKQGLEELGEAAKKSLNPKQLGLNVATAVTNAIESNVDAMFGAQGRINTRLQGNILYGSNGEKAFNELVDTVQSNVGMSGVVSQKTLVSKMEELADSGVVYNLEMRAFLAATAENIASTFDVFDSNLLRLIRIQQADTTAARMGMEQSLTELFNKYFSDSSYMNQGGAADSVSASIIDAMSQMTRDNALSFEYTLQKWLGALYSLGLSDEAVSTIAQGINYLGTGNVNALNSNDTLQTLLAMSAARSGGKSYAELLTTGLTAEDTNDLLKSMIEYLAEIAGSQKNMVTKAAYSDLFGMSITDLSTFQQLHADEIANLYETTLNYSQMMDKTQTQLSTMVSRLNIGKIIDTAMENAMTGASVELGTNPALYGTWKVLNQIESLTGGIPIPAVLAAGFGVNLNASVEQLAKAGIGGLSLMSSLLSSLFGGGLFGTIDLNDWSYEGYETTSRGGAITQLFEGSSSSLSQSTEMNMVGSSSANDIRSVSMNDATQEAQKEAGTSSEEMQEGKELNERIYEAIAASESDTVLAQLHRVVELLDEKRVFYTASSSGGFTTSSRVSSILSAYNSLESNAVMSNTVATAERTSLLHEIAQSTSLSAANSAASAEGDTTLSDVIVQAVTAALIASANDLTFKTEIDNSFGNPIAVKSVV